jgi:hypothetical protein
VVERRSEPGGGAIAVLGVPVKALRDTAVYLTGWSRRVVSLRTAYGDLVTALEDGTCRLRQIYSVPRTGKIPAKSRGFPLADL